MEEFEFIIFIFSALLIFAFMLVSWMRLAEHDKVELDTFEARINDFFFEILN